MTKTKYKVGQYVNDPQLKKYGKIIEIKEGKSLRIDMGGHDLITEPEGFVIITKEEFIKGLERKLKDSQRTFNENLRDYLYFTTLDL